LFKTKFKPDETNWTIEQELHLKKHTRTERKSPLMKPPKKDRERLCELSV